jgi:hypothetical protein
VRARDDVLERLARRVEELGWAMERASLAEYVRLFDRPWRLMGLNFLAGLARGVGVAVGFLILGALLIYALTTIRAWNLPGLGHFIADIVRIVQQELRAPR